MTVNPVRLIGRIKSRGSFELQNFRAKGLYEAGRLVTDRAVQRLCLSRFRTAMRPSLHQLAGEAQSVHMSAVDMVRASFPSISASELSSIEEEYSAVRAELERRCDEMNDRLEYPEWYAIESETSFLYYAACRHFAPGNVLETGIANGHSTFFLLQAMKKNGKGSLHSVDIAENVGSLLTEEERAGWTLHVLGSPQRKSFSRILDSVSPLDLFVHDSDHTYGWQMFEYRVARKALSKQGVLLSDDIDHSLAFVDFCEEIDQKPVLLLDTRKVTGMLLPKTQS
jgi:predicted O-methyltransferase YrrM